MGKNTLSYQDFANTVQQELNTDLTWQAQYAGYANDLLDNETRLKEARKHFHQKKPLPVYLSIGSAQSKTPQFNLRFLGQSIGDLQVKGDDVFLKITKNQAENNKQYFSNKEDATEEIFVKAGNYPWNGKHAAEIRDAFANRLSDPAYLPRQHEHMVESALYSEFEKASGETKALCGIQPIMYADCRFHMKTALKASLAKNDIVEESESGGDIDLFCRRKIGNQSYLTVIEIKDENKATETPEKAIKQAIAYAVFIRELLRCDCGEKWKKIWGVENQHWENSVTLNAVIAMPQKDADDLSFVGQEIRLGNDIIRLHYISFVGERKLRDGEAFEIKTSL